MAATHKPVRFMKIQYFMWVFFVRDSIYVCNSVHICALLVFAHGNIIES